MCVVRAVFLRDRDASVFSLNRFQEFFTGTCPAGSGHPPDLLLAEQSRADSQFFSLSSKTPYLCFHLLLLLFQPHLITVALVQRDTPYRC